MTTRLDDPTTTDPVVRGMLVVTMAITIPADATAALEQAGFQ
jgi:hypothetical protein